MTDLSRQIARDIDNPTWANKRQDTGKSSMTRQRSSIAVGNARPVVDLTSWYDAIIQDGAYSANCLKTFC